eukprot:4579940-Prymnesium_polylepis.1
MADVAMVDAAIEARASERSPRAWAVGVCFCSEHVFCLNLVVLFARVHFCAVPCLVRFRAPHRREHQEVDDRGDRPQKRRARASSCA